MNTDPTSLASLVTVLTGIIAGGTILYRLVRGLIRPDRVSYRIEIARDDDGPQVAGERTVSRL